MLKLIEKTIHWSVFIVSVFLIISSAKFIGKELLSPFPINITEGGLIGVECGYKRLKTIELLIDTVKDGEERLYFIGIHCDLLNGLEAEVGENVRVEWRRVQLLRVDSDSTLIFAEESPLAPNVFLLIVGLTFFSVLLIKSDIYPDICRLKGKLRRM